MARDDSRQEMIRDHKISQETGDDRDDKKLIKIVCVCVCVRVCVSQKQHIESCNHDSRGPGTLVAAPRTPKSRPLSLRKR